MSMNLLILFLTILSLPLSHSAKPPQHDNITQSLPGSHNHVRSSITPAASRADDNQEAQLIAALDYGTFKGSYSKEFNITYYQKIPFAAPPTGQNRFRAPQPPLNLAALHGAQYIYNASQPFDMCPQRTVNGSEDCLYLALYSRPWFQHKKTSQSSQSLRPVVIVFYGGGFIRGSASFSTLPPSAYPALNVSSENDLVFIYPNYRTNAFGFLAGKQIMDDYPFSDTNVGLLDQRAAIRWAKKYVAQFGGDPDDISIWGQSAGGGSVLAQVIGDHEFDQPVDSVQGGKEKGKGGLFKALTSSPYWPKTYSATSPEAQWIYDTLVNRTVCGAPTEQPANAVFDNNTLSCLKSLPVQSILTAAEYIASSHTYTTSSYTFAPVIDGRFLPRTLTQAISSSLFNSETILATYNTHEGENFLPPLLLHDDDQQDPPEGSVAFTTWLTGFLPNLMTQDLKAVKMMYPETTTETMVKNSSSVPTVRAGLIYRDVVLACPAYWLTGAAAASSSSSSDGVYKGFVGAFASFFATGDPNKRKLTSPETPGIPKLNDDEKDEEFVIQSDGFTTAKITSLKKRCDFWTRLAPRIPI
ncbi:carboxylesterase [Rhypophila decipiens]|uniref:Carboxylic ester hydrolase n=1 Tax=Rhypophila decipiens TaxID=261697 RepID=A0AAN7B7U5_9PEZI|nr:carboxylesterase [Rhypophila decipiens]